MHRLRSAILLLPVLLAACQATPATSPLLQKVQQIKADGTLAPVGDKELTPFQQLVRARILPQLPFDVLALEMDRPEGEGTEGAYFAIIHMSGSVELRYYEQNDHLPRVDRYFHRALSTAEIGELNGFLKTHTLMQMAAHAAVPVETPATQPATQPATLPAVLSDSPPAPASEATATDDSAPAVMATVIRITQAHAKESRTLLLDSPAKDQPADQLLQLLIRFRETGTLACSYLQSFPPSARMLFSDPHRKVLQVWTHGEDLRVSITPKPADPPAENPESQWFAFQDNQWSPSEPPPEPAVLEPQTQAAPQPAAQLLPVPPAPPPAAPTVGLVPQDLHAVQPVIPQAATTQAATTKVAAPAVEPSRFSNPGMLPVVESWWTQQGPNYTTVWHYVPLSTRAGLTLGFVVPSFLFDDDHMAVDVQRETLYLIHEGQLFSLPIPKPALRPQ